MITHETRQLSFEDIKPKRQERYNLILKHLDKPKTVMELTKEIFDSDNRNLVAPRLTELEKMNKVVVAGKKVCKWTGKKVAIYKKTESKARTCENCEWSCNQVESEFLKCLIDSKEKGLCEYCHKFKAKTGNHITSLGG